MKSRTRSCPRLLVAYLSIFTLAAPALAVIGSPSRLQRVSDLITEIDLSAAEKILDAVDSSSPGLAFERARLALYRGDCMLAGALLSSAGLAETKEGASLKELADSCARATVATFAVEDRARGIAIRFQDDADRALAPFIFDVAVRSRDAIERQVGVQLVRPLRIDLVRDLFSLSAVSGLPLSAAETTGTLAVARWGRVILLSPRAASMGFPWEDTLAHEITHLVITRATRDHAPLWLQEGMAKRLESSWRAERPFDDPEWADSVAYRAMLEGRSIGIDRLGPSIAMLPTPEAASIAFAEVTSFVGFFIARAGEPALRLLFADLRGSGEQGADIAFRSVTGRTLEEWNAEWQRAIEERKPSAAPRRRGGSRDLARELRLSELLLKREHALAAAEAILPAITPDQTEPLVRFQGARALLNAGEEERADQALGALTEITSMYGPWFALHGRRLRRIGEGAPADRAFRVGIAVHPLSVDVACEGELRSEVGEGLPSTRARQELCRAARAVPKY